MNVFLTYILKYYSNTPAKYNKFNSKQKFRFAMGTRICSSSMFGSKSCHMYKSSNRCGGGHRLFRSTFLSVHTKTIFQEWTYVQVFIQIHFLERFQINAFSVNTLSLSRTDTATSRSGSPNDASNPPTY